MPRVAPQPRPSPHVPRTGFDADALLGDARTMALDRHTRMRRLNTRDIVVEYVAGTWRETLAGRHRLVTFHQDGRVQVALGAAFTLPEFRRVAPAIPREWVVEWRLYRRRPLLVYRGSYSLTLPGRCTFHPNGDFEWGDGARITLDDLNGYADERENVTPMRSRRRTPRPLPRYIVRTSVRTRGEVDEEYETPVPDPTATPQPRFFTRLDDGPVITPEQSAEWARLLRDYQPTFTVPASYTYTPPEAPAPMVEQEHNHTSADGHIPCVCGTCHFCQSEGGYIRFEEVP